MRLRNKCGLSLLFACLPITLLAAPLTLKVVLDSVTQFHPLVAVSLIDLRQSQNRLLASEGAFDPIVKAKLDTTQTYYDTTYSDIWVEQPMEFMGTRLIAGYRRGVGDFPVYDGGFKTNSDGEFRAGFQLPLLRNNATDLRRTELEKSRAFVTASELQYDFTLQEFLRMASLTYWDWISDGVKLTVIYQLLTLAEDRDSGLRFRVSKGDLPEFERQDNLRTILLRKGQKLSFQRNFQRSSYLLSLFYRDNQGNPIVPSADSVPPALLKQVTQQLKLDRVETYLANALKTRKDLLRLSELKRQLQLDFAFSQNQLLPQLDFTLFGSKDSGGPTSKMNDPQIKAALNFELPIFYRTGEGRNLFAQAAVEKIELQERFLRDRIQADLLNAHMSLQNAIDRTQLAQQETELAFKLKEAEAFRFTHGDSSILILNLREQAYADAMIKEIEAQADAQKMKTELHFIQGQDLRSL